MQEIKVSFHRYYCNFLSHSLVGKAVDRFSYDISDDSSSSRPSKRRRLQERNPFLDIEAIADDESEEEDEEDDGNDVFIVHGTQYDFFILFQLY